MQTNKMWLVAAAIATTSLVILGSSFTTSSSETTKNNKAIDPAYFEYTGTDELGSSLKNPSNWQMLSAPSESECPTEGGIICVTQIDELPDYGGTFDTPEKNFAHYLDLQSDDGVTYISTPANRVREKEE
ncbi:hypothetical protein GCM10027051_17400 [Niabella terrae]